jgi:uncharacterized protein (DUF58 family)
VAHRNTRGRGLEFRDFAEYSPGEDPRRIDWRMTARMTAVRRKPYVRTFDDELSADWFVCVDASASMGRPDRSKWALALELASAFAYLLLSSGNRVGLIQFSDSVDHFCPLGRGRHHYVRIAEALNSNQPRAAGGNSLLSTVGGFLPTGSHAVVLSDFLTPDAMRGALARLRRPGRMLEALQILSPGETILRDQLTHHLQDVETGDRISVSGSAAGRAGVALAELSESLRAFCGGNGIRFTLCHTSMSWRDAIVSHLGAS